MKLYALILSCLLSAGTAAAEVVKVGIYDFPPYVFISDKPSGIAVQMIAEMNRFQKDYEFVAMPTTSKRRYRDFENSKFDMIIFENKDWGWQGYPVDVSDVFVTGAEVYVTQAKPGRGQGYFADFKNKAMIMVLGYHYRFADFRTDQDYLQRHFNFLQTSGQKKKP